MSNFPFLPEADLALYRVTGPNGQGPIEVQGRSSLNAVQNATAQHPEMFGDIDGIGQPSGQHGPVVGYHRTQGTQTHGAIGAFDVAFLGWAA